MASPNTYPNGLNLAGTVFENGPATLQLSGPTFVSGAVQWLHSSGSDANAGTLPELPVATLAQAITNSTTDGLIVIGEGHSESLGVSQTISLANLSIFGCGAGSNRPRFTCTATIAMFNVTGAGLWIEGVYFPASTAVAVNRISLVAANGTVKDCYFECGANDTNAAVKLGAGGNSSKVDGCSFVTTASRPGTGLRITSGVVDPVVTNCTFDGGAYGWSDYALKGDTTAPTRIRLIGNTFTNRSDLGVTVTGTTYQMYGNTFAGTSNVVITA